MNKEIDLIKESWRDRISETIGLIGVGVFLMAGNKDKSLLKEWAQSQNIELKIQKYIEELDTEVAIKQCMMDSVQRWVHQIPLKAISDILLALDRGLTNAPPIQLFDEMVLSTSNRTDGITPATPYSVNRIVQSYLSKMDKTEVSYFDGTAGYGYSATSFAMSNPNTKIYLQDINVESATILMIRLSLLDLRANVAVADTLEVPMKVENELQQFDMVSMSPPWGMKLTEQQIKAMELDSFNRYAYGIPSRVQGDFAFVSCGLSATKATGKATFWLPAGTLFRSGPERKIRQRLIDLDVIEAIVLLPSSLLAPFSSVESVLLLCNKDKKPDRKGKILMINARDLGTSIRRETYIDETNLQLLDDIINQGLEQQSISMFVMNNEVDNAQLSPETYVYKNEIELEEFGNVKLDLDVMNGLKTLPLKDMAQLYRGYNVSPKDEDANGDYAVLKISDIVNGVIQVNELSKYKIQKNAKINNNLICNNDIVLSIRGTNRKIALFKSTREDVLISQNFVGIRCSNSLLPAFLKLYLESPVAQFHFSNHIVGSTIQNLPIHAVSNLPIPILTMEEQENIVRAYEEEVMDIAKRIEDLERRQKQVKLQAFEKMGLGDTFEIL